MSSARRFHSNCLWIDLRKQLQPGETLRRRGRRRPWLGRQNSPRPLAEQTAGLGALYRSKQPQWKGKRFSTSSVLRTFSEFFKTNALFLNSGETFEGPFDDTVIFKEDVDTARMPLRNIFLRSLEYLHDLFVVKFWSKSFILFLVRFQCN